MGCPQTKSRECEKCILIQDYSAHAMVKPIIKPMGTPIRWSSRVNGITCQVRSCHRFQCINRPMFPMVPLQRPPPTSSQQRQQTHQSTSSQQTHRRIGRIPARMCGTHNTRAGQCTLVRQKSPGRCRPRTRRPAGRCMLPAVDVPKPERASLGGFRKPRCDPGPLAQPLRWPSPGLQGLRRALNPSSSQSQVAWGPPCPSCVSMHTQHIHIHTHAHTQHHTSLRRLRTPVPGELSFCAGRGSGFSGFGI